MASSSFLPLPASGERVGVRGIVCALLFSCAGAPISVSVDPTLQPTRGAPATVSELLSRSDATVFVFWSAGCPCVRRYQARVDSLATEWSSRGVAFLEISSNAGETLESLRAAEHQRGLARVLWRDEGGLLARQLGARSTPTVVLVRRDGAVLYRGWLDNERQPGEDGREAWLESALRGFVGGGPALATSPTWGCTITRSLSSPLAPQCHAPSTVASSATSAGGSP